MNPDIPPTRTSRLTTAYLSLWLFAWILVFAILGIFLITVGEVLTGVVCFGAVYVGVWFYRKKFVIKHTENIVNKDSVKAKGN